MDDPLGMHLREQFWGRGHSRAWIFSFECDDGVGLGSYMNCVSSQRVFRPVISVPFDCGNYLGEVIRLGHIFLSVVED